jgi:thiol:disulfide interchange protein DsbD
MLAFAVVHGLRRWLVVTLIVLGSASGVQAGSDKVSLSLELDTPETARGGETGLTVFAEIQRGWHINGHKPNEPFLIPTEVSFTLPPGISTDTLNYPRPDRRAFAFAPGKELLVYEGKIGITTALSVPADFAGTRVRVAALLRYQACNDSTCLPPATASAEVVVPVSVRVAAAPPAAPVVPHAADIDVGAWLATHGLLVTLFLVGLLGLGLNLTPCVYPLISVTVAYFGTQGGHRGARMAALAALYVLGITLSFSVVGVVAALSGGIFGAALQRPPVLIFIAAVLVALALSSFGLYQLQPPAWLMRRVSGSIPGAVGAFFMGVTMGVVAAPCVGPVILGLLLFVGSQQSVVLGVELFSALGLGMGVPYLALAMAAGSIKALPRSGAWLVWIERLFGVLLLALAAYFISPLLPKAAGRLLLPVVIGAGGIYLGFLDRSGRSVRSFRSIQRLAGIIALAVAVWFALPQRVESAIRWVPFDGSSLAAARSAGRPAIIDFVADWCIPCHEMERTTFVDPQVRREAERFATFKADITRETEETGELVDQYAVRGVPTLIFVDSAGTEVRRLVGYVAPDEMLTVMRGVQ